MTKEALRNNEIEYCKDHIEYFIETYGHIEVKKVNEPLVRKFELWDAQKEALHSFCNHRLNIALKARQLGFSWMACHIAAHLLLTRSGRLCIALSRSEEEAKELIRRVEFISTSARILFPNKITFMGSEGLGHHPTH